LDRIRTRIARDLHDDIGATLSQIALLSEIVQARVHGDLQVAGAVRQIGRLSREAVDSMSDIVWSLDPGSDTLGHTIERMRDFAGEVFAARGVAFCFRAPDAGDNLKIGTHARRQLFLAFKESVNNIARHAECTEAEAELAIERGWLQLKLGDNGKGFDCRRTALGHGLNSMRNRARSMGGEFQVASSTSGTGVTLRIPIDARPGERTRTTLQTLLWMESTWKGRLFASASSKINTSRASC
jgi:signal transduction histidine kinase